MWPIWGPPGSCRPQVGLMLAQWTLLSGLYIYVANIYSKVVPIKQWRGDNNSFSAIRRWILLDRVNLIMYYHYYWFDNGVTLNMLWWSYVGSPVDRQKWPRIPCDPVTLNSTELSCMAWHRMYRVHIQATKAAGFTIDIRSSSVCDSPVIRKNMHFDPWHLT